MNIIDNNIAIIFRFPKDKINKETRAELAKEFADILGVNTLVCDKDCKMTIIQHSNKEVGNEKVME